MKYLSASDVILIHDGVINAHELQGEASGKSVESVIARVLNRLEYGLIGDVFELAACYAAFIAVAHAFNDANKRTAFATMDAILAINGIELDYVSPEDAGGMIVKVVVGEVDELGLADWLRQNAEKSC